MSIQEFSSRLPYAGMIANGVIVTKDALLLRTFSFRGKDFAFANDSDILTSLRNLNNSFRFLGDGWTLYIDAFRRRRDTVPSFFSPGAPEAAKGFERCRESSIGEYFYNDFYITFCYSIEEKKNVSSFMFKTDADSSIKNDVAKFISITDDLYNMYQAVFHQVKKLDADELLTYLHSCFSEHHPVITPDCPFYLDVYLSDAKFTPDTICKLNDDFLLTASIHDFPSTTHTGMITTLLKRNIEFRLTTRFIFLSKEKAKKQIKDFRMHHFQKRKGIGSIISEAIFKHESALQDTEALSLTSDSDQAIESLADGDINFGYLTTSIIVREKNYRTAKAHLDELKKLVNECGFVCRTETFNNPFVFLGSLPGNIAENARKPLISTRNLLHFFPVSDTWEGQFTNEHLNEITGIDFPHMITKSSNSLFYLNLNVGDVGHTLVLGPTGAGKSILLNTLALQYFRYPNTQIFFFDKDKSSQFTCRNCDGVFYDIGSPESDYFFNPFYGIDEKTHRMWLSQFLGAFIQSRGIPISARDQNELFDALESMSGHNLENLTFNTFQKTIQDENIRAALTVFTEGDYSYLFKPVCDQFSNNRFIVFEMGSLMRQNEEIVRFILGYLFYRLQKMFDGTPTLLVLDEAWLFLDNEYFASMLRDWLKTLRKKNVYVVLATQEVADAKSTIFSTILNACMTKILLPNPQANQSENIALYKELGLTESDIVALAEATPKKDYFYFSPRGKQMFDLCLCENQLRVLKTTKEVIHA